MTEESKRHNDLVTRIASCIEHYPYSTLEWATARQIECSVSSMVCGADVVACLEACELLVKGGYLVGRTDECGRRLFIAQGEINDSRERYP